MYECLYLRSFAAEIVGLTSTKINAVPAVVKSITMDMGEFVAEVRKRECLWNRKVLPLSADQRKTCDKLWQEVGKACKIPKETAKMKWRSLRDHFYKLLKRVPVYTTGETYYIEESEKPNWPHFNHLTFLLKTYNPKQKVINIKDESIIDIRSSSDSESCSGDEETHTDKVAPTIKNSAPRRNTVVSRTPDLDNKSNISELEIKEEQATACEESLVPVEDGQPPLAMVKPQLPVPTFTSIKRVYTIVETDDVDGTTTPIENRSERPSKRMALESNVNSNVLKESDDSTDETENMAFFRSLLPFMKKLDPIQQLRVRMRCQESLLEEMGALNN